MTAETMEYPTYADARAGYSGQYVSYSQRSLEAMENRLLDEITWTRWRGTPAEVQVAHVQAELELRQDRPTCPTCQNEMRTIYVPAMHGENGQYGPAEEYDVCDRCAEEGRLPF